MLVSVAYLWDTKVKVKRIVKLLDTSKIIISRDVRFLPLDDDESRKDN